MIPALLILAVAVLANIAIWGPLLPLRARRFLRMLPEPPFVQPHTGRHVASEPRADRRFPCCEHCTDGSPCDPADNHLAPCGDGCNDAAPRPQKQPWQTGEMPALPSPPPQHAYDPGDGAWPPVALVRPYQAAAERGEWGVRPQLEAARPAKAYLP